MLGKKNSGFTLLELLVVISLAMIAIGITVSNFSSSNSSAIFKGFTRELIALLRHSRSSAMAGDQIIWLEINEETGRLTLQPSGQSVQVPAGIEVTLGSDFLPGMHAEGVYFYPDGSTNFAQVTLLSEVGQAEISVNGLSGEVSLVPQ